LSKGKRGRGLLWLGRSLLQGLKARRFEGRLRLKLSFLVFRRCGSRSWEFIFLKITEVIWKIVSHIIEVVVIVIKVQVIEVWEISFFI
jgi:hypothetical protein